MTVEHESEQPVRTQTPPESAEPEDASGGTLGAIESVLEMIDQLEAKSETELGASLQEIRAALEPIAAGQRPEGRHATAPRVVPAAAAAADPEAPSRPPSGDEEEDLLFGDFESVSDVLSEVFGARAAFVQDTVEDATVLRSDASLEEPLRDQPTATSSGQKSFDVFERESALAEEPSPEVAAALEAMFREPLPTSSATAVRPPAAARSRRTAAKAGRILKSILVGMSLPRRLLPPQVRLVIDLLAITLVFWVPVVWLIAILS